MEYYNKILCLTYADLTAGDKGAVIGASTLRSNVMRGNIYCVRRGGGEGVQALYAWNTLPRKYKERYMEMYGDPEERIKEMMRRESVKLDASAREYYEGYTYEGADGGRAHLTARMIDEYTVNASVLGELLRLYNRRKAVRGALCAGMGDVWSVIYDSCEAMREEYRHTLPSSKSRLKEKMKQYREDGYASLISGKLGSRNALKITEDFLRQIVALKRSKTPVYTDAQLFERVNEIAAANGWKPIKSLSGMKKWLYSPEVEPLWYDAVHGEAAARQRYNRKQKTALPTRRDSLWYGDGTKLNLYYRDDKGVARTTQVYEVIDAMSEVLLGYWISDAEDYEAQYHAYRMAIQTAKHKPYEIVTDNQGGHKKLGKDGFMGKICRIHRPTMPYNGESKTIESVFGRFQQQVLHKDWRFTGQNVTAVKKSSRPDLEFIKANSDKLYTLDELKAAYAEARKEWNEMPHPATGERRIDMYENSVNEETQEVTVYDMVDMFWVFTKEPATFTDQGIRISVKGKQYTYEVFSEPGVPDHAWRRRNTYKRFICAYDPCDPTSVRLYTLDANGEKRFERVAEPYMVVHRAQQDQAGTDDKAFLRREMEANLQDRIERVAEGRAIAFDHGTDPEQNGLTMPVFKGTSEEIKRQVERRMTRLSRKDDAVLELGRVTKRVSLADWQEVEEETEAQSSGEDYAERL